MKSKKPPNLRMRNNSKIRNLRVSILLLWLFLYGEVDWSHYPFSLPYILKKKKLENTAKSFLVFHYIYIQLKLSNYSGGIVHYFPNCLLHNNGTDDLRYFSKLNDFDTTVACIGSITWMFVIIIFN